MHFLKLLALVALAVVIGVAPAAVHALVGPTAGIIVGIIMLAAVVWLLERVLC